MQEPPGAPWRVRRCGCREALFLPARQTRTMRRPGLRYALYGVQRYAAQRESCNLTISSAGDILRRIFFGFLQKSC